MKLTDLIEEQKRRFSAEQSDEDGFVSRYEYDILRHLVDSMTLAYEAGQKAERNSYIFDINGKLYLAKELVKHIEHHDKLNASFERGRVDAFEEMLATLTPPTTEDLSGKTG